MMNLYHCLESWRMLVFLIALSKLQYPRVNEWTYWLKKWLLPYLFVWKIYVKSLCAAGSVATQTLVVAIWSFKMGTMSAGCL